MLAAYGSAGRSEAPAEIAPVENATFAGWSLFATLDLPKIEEQSS